MSVEYPIFAFEKDDHSMWLIENESRIFYHLEEADVINGEYVFWDANGGGVTIRISTRKMGLGGVTIQISGKMTGPAPAQAQFPLSEAMVLFAKSKRIAPPDAISSPIEAWTRIQDELSRRPKKKGILSRILSRL